MRTPLILDRAKADQRSGAIPAEAFRGHVGQAFGVAAAAFSFGTIIDLFTLWVLQHQNQPEWEFIAITRTMEAFPRFILAIALLYGGLYFAQSASLLWYRAAGVGTILLGLAAVGLGLLMITDYIVLSNLAAGQGEAITMLRAGAAKSLLLSAIFSVLLIPVGFMALRRPRVS